jgi:hypothetical protein
MLRVQELQPEATGASTPADRPAKARIDVVVSRGSDAAELITRCGDVADIRSHLTVDRNRSFQGATHVVFTRGTPHQLLGQAKAAGAILHGPFAGVGAMAEQIGEIAEPFNHPNHPGAIEMKKHRTPPSNGNDRADEPTHPAKAAAPREPLPGLFEMACHVSRDVTDAASRAVGFEVKEMADNLETLIDLRGDKLETLVTSQAETLGVLRDQLKHFGQGLTQTWDAVARGVGDLDLRVADLRAEVNGLRQQYATGFEQITVTWAESHLAPLSEQISRLAEEQRHANTELQRQSKVLDLLVSEALTGLQACGKRLEWLEAALAEVRAMLAGNRKNLTDLTEVVRDFHADLAMIYEAHQDLVQMVHSLSASVAKALDQRSVAPIKEAEPASSLPCRIYRSLGRLFSWLKRPLTP